MLLNTKTLQNESVEASLNDPPVTSGRQLKNPSSYPNQPYVLADLGSPSFVKLY